MGSDKSLGSLPTEEPDIAALMQFLFRLEKKTCGLS